MTKYDFSDVQKPDVKHTKGVRVYGLTVGHGSLQRVTRGMSKGLKQLGALAGFMPTDRYDDEENYSGAFAEVALHEGIPRSVVMMSSRGFHERAYAILAPNSTWLPEEIIELILKHAKIAAPSAWGAGIVKAYAPEDRVCVYQHGVDVDVFQPRKEARHRAYDAFKNGSFRVLHLSSSDRERKGTLELIQAWGSALRHKRLGPRPKLSLIIAGLASEYHEAVTQWITPGDQSTVTITPALNLPGDDMAGLYSHQHVLCQPSRAEGFGLCPLEARACGVPVVATDCTGHGCHVAEGLPGVVVVPTGPDAPIDDGPGALAPSLDWRAVEDGLEHAYSTYPDLCEAALSNASLVAQEWSWKKQTELWLRAEEIEWT